MIDTILIFENYVNHVAKTCNFYICDKRYIRRSITCDVANNMADCVVGTHLEYCNALLHGATEKSLNKMR